MIEWIIIGVLYVLCMVSTLGFTVYGDMKNWEWFVLAMAWPITALFFLYTLIMDRFQ